MWVAVSHAKGSMLTLRNPFTVLVPSKLIVHVGCKNFSSLLDVSTTKRVKFLFSYWISTIMCLTSSTCCQQENFAGKNFHELVFDCKIRENSHYMVPHSLSPPYPGLPLSFPPSPPSRSLPNCFHNSRK